MALLWLRPRLEPVEQAFGARLGERGRRGKLFWPGERSDELVPHVRRLWAGTLSAL